MELSFILPFFVMNLNTVTMNIELNIRLHTFNEEAIDALLMNVPEFANGNRPELLNLNQKKQIYSQIKQMDHDQSNNTYNLFFEAAVSALN